MTDAFPIPDSLKKAAFDLGWDFAAYAGLRLPDDAPEDMIQGFNIGVHRLAGRRKDHDIYIRKWLLLRTNALRRGREVSPEVTPEYLRMMNRGICPITLKPFTYGTGDESDWSIDRMNNDSAYAPGALAIMSVKANKAKGARCFDDIVAITQDGATAQNGTFRGLTTKEWLRMAALSMRPCLIEERPELVVAQCTFVPNGLVTSMPQIVQHRMLLDAIGVVPGLTQPFRKLGGEKGMKRYRKLMEKLTKTAPRTQRARWPEVAPFDIWLNDQVFAMFNEWLDLVTAAEIDGALAKSMRGISAVQVRKGAFTSWSLDTGGYAV